MGKKEKLIARLKTNQKTLNSKKRKRCLDFAGMQ